MNEEVVKEVVVFASLDKTQKLLKQKKEDIIKTIRQKFGPLKTTKDLERYLYFSTLNYRRGLLGLEHVENTPTHMYKMAVLAEYMIKKFNLKVNLLRCIELILSHDLAESLLGDIVPDDNIDEEKKIIAEREVFKSVFSEPDFVHIKDAFLEFDEEKTDEAKLANFIDKLDFYYTLLFVVDPNNEKDLELLEKVKANLKQRFLGLKISGVDLYKEMVDLF